MVAMAQIKSILAAEYDRAVLNSRKLSRERGDIPRSLTRCERDRMRMRCSQARAKSSARKEEMERLVNDMDSFDEKVGSFPALLTRTNTRDLLAVKRKAGLPLTLFDD